MHFDYVVVGAGVVGLSIARALLLKGQGRVLVLEKEKSLGLHSSGRNSGVLHSGIYYPPGSLKAKLCVEGARRLREYILSKGLPHLKCGKLIVAQRESLTGQIPLLIDRSKANGVEVRAVSVEEIREIEPLARSHGPALFSPNTWVFDPLKVIESLRQEIHHLGGEVRLDSFYRNFDPESRQVSTNTENLSGGYLINAAGLWADEVAHQQNVGTEFRILPFRGRYFELRADLAEQVRGLIYPVPDLELPFLGVHVTRAARGYVTVGPTAMPAMGRENYRGLSGFQLNDATSVSLFVLGMAWHNRNNMRNHMIEEIQLHSPRHFERRLQELCPSIRAQDLLPSQKVGLRAQLVNSLSGKLEMDFLIREGRRSLHVLNAVSPAFSASLAFADLVLNQLPKDS